MTSSLSVTFSGASSVLQCNFLPEISLDENSEYECALVDFILQKSTQLDKILKLDVLQIECDIIFDSYINGATQHVIHQFPIAGARAKGGSLVEIPKHLIYHPIKTKSLRSIQILITDQLGTPISTSGGQIICRLHIKRISKEKSIQA